MGDDKGKKKVVIQESYCYEEEIELTVHKTSMFCQGDGFTAYDSKGDIIFRVHSYGPIKHPILLMDCIGNPLLTLLPKVKKELVVEERYCYEKERELTVHKASMFSQGDGFIVYDSKGDIVFRVDSYAPTKNRLLLMDSIGKPLLTLLPKRPTLHHRWAAFLGEITDERQPQPIFSIWKSTMIGQSNVMVEVHGESPIMYQIEGSYCERSCTLFRVPSLDDDRSKVSVAQINRKIEPTRKMVLGRDVFTLIIKPGCDAAFVMGLVLALDRIVGDDAAAHIECHNSQRHSNIGL